MNARYVFGVPGGSDPGRPFGLMWEETGTGKPTDGGMELANEKLAQALGAIRSGEMPPTVSPDDIKLE